MKKSVLVKKANQPRRPRIDDALESQPERRKAFGEWMKKQRESLGMNQQDAADAADISRVQWARIEGGDGTKYKTVRAIAEALGHTTPAQKAWVYRLAGFAVGDRLTDLPPELADFPRLPYEVQRDIIGQIRRAIELEEIKKEKRGK